MNRARLVLSCGTVFSGTVKAGEREGDKIKLVFEVQVEKVHQNAQRK